MGNELCTRGESFHSDVRPSSKCRKRGSTPEILQPPAQRVILLDYDGPVNDHVKPPSFARSKCEATLGRIFEQRAYDSELNMMGWHAAVTNHGLLDACFATLDGKPEVRLLPGSQRCAMGSGNMQSLSVQSYHEMYATFDHLFGKDRRYFLKKDGDRLAADIDDAHSLNTSKLMMLSNVTTLHGCQHLKKSDICLVDDNPVYRASTEGDHYHFIQCTRSNSEIFTDSSYIFEMLRWALQEDDERIAARILCCRSKYREQMSKMFKQDCKRKAEAIEDWPPALGGSRGSAP